MTGGGATGGVLVRGGHVLTSAPPDAPTPSHLRDGAVLIRAGRVAAVGPYRDLAAGHPGATVYGDAYDIVVPGFVNTHGHFSEGLISGMAEQFTLWEWIHGLIDRVSGHLTREMAYIGTLLAGVQMLRSGITLANDMFCSDPGLDQPLTPGVVDALEDLGLRGVVSFGAGDVGSDRGVGAELDEHAALAEAAAASRLCTFRVGIGSVGGQSDAMFARSVELAVGGGHGVHIHLQEVREEVTAVMRRAGVTPVRFCAREGLFEAPTLAAHCVWVDRADRELLAGHHVGVAHNPVSNMILGSGVAPVAEMRALGVDVGIGVDGPASNDRQDMLEAIKTAALLARVHHRQATAMTAAEAFEMATLGGARALQMQDEVGSLEPGKAADLVVLDGTSPALANVHDPVQAVVYVAGPREVKDVWVAGERRVTGGEVVGVDVAEVVARSRPLARRLVRQAGLAHLSELAR